MRPVAKRFGLRTAAAAEGDDAVDRIGVPIGVRQDERAANEVRPALANFDR